MKREIRQFGILIKRPDLAEVVEHLYDAALQKSSRRTYKTGQRAYLRFINELSGGCPLRREWLRPFKQKSLGRTELSLAFFMAYLVLQPSISAASTILGYVTHVKYRFRENGCTTEEYQTPLLGQVR